MVISGAIEREQSNELKSLIISEQDLKQSDHRALAIWLMRILSYDKILNVSESRHLQQLLIILIDSDLGCSFHLLIARCLVKLFKEYDTVLLLEAVNKCHLTLQKSNAKICALTILNQLYSQLSKFVGRSFEETVNLCSKIILEELKGAPKDEQVALHSLVFTCCSSIILNMRSAGKTTHRTILRMVQRLLLYPKHCAKLLNDISITFSRLICADPSNLMAVNVEKCVGSIVDCIEYDIWTEDCGNKWITIAHSLAIVVGSRGNESLNFFDLIASNDASRKKTSCIDSNEQFNFSIARCFEQTFIELFKELLVSAGAAVHQNMSQILSVALSICKIASCPFLARQSRNCVDAIFSCIIYELNGIDNSIMLLTQLTDICVRTALNIVSEIERRSLGHSHSAEAAINSLQNMLFCSIEQLTKVVLEIGDSMSIVIDDSSIGFLQAIQTIVQTKSRRAQLLSANLIFHVAKLCPKSVINLMSKQWLATLNSEFDCEGYSYCTAAAIYAFKDNCELSKGTIEFVFDSAMEILKSRKGLSRNDHQPDSFLTGWTLICAATDYLLKQSKKNFLEKRLKSVLELIEQEFLFGLRTFDTSNLVGKIGALTCLEVIAVCDDGIDQLLAGTYGIVISKGVGFMKELHENINSNEDLKKRIQKNKYLTNLYELRLIQCLLVSRQYHLIPNHSKSWLLRRLLMNSIHKLRSREAIYLHSSESLGDCALVAQTDVYTNILPMTLLVISSIDARMFSAEIDDNEKDMFKLIFSNNENTVSMQISECSATLVWKLTLPHKNQTYQMLQDAFKIQRMILKSENGKEYGHTMIWFASVLIMSPDWKRIEAEEEEQCRIVSLLKKVFMDCVMDESVRLQFRLQSAKFLGHLIKCSKSAKVWIGTLCDELKKTIANQNVEENRIVSCYCLGVLYRNGGFQSQGVKSTADFLINLILMDSSNHVVQVWALRSLAMMIDGCGVSYIANVNRTTKLIVDVLLNERASSNYNEINSVRQACLRLLSSMITTVGPDLGDGKVWSEFLNDIRLVYSLVRIDDRSKTDCLVQSIYFDCQEQLHVFCPKLFNLNSILSELWTGVHSDDFIIRFKALQCLRHLCQREANEVSQYIKKFEENGSTLEEHLFSMLDREQTPIVAIINEIKDTIYLLQAGIGDGSTLTEWIDLLSRILKSTSSKVSGSENFLAKKAHDRDDGDDEDDKFETVHHAADTDKGSDDHHDRNIFCGWKSRMLAAECVLQLVGAQEYFDSNAQNVHNAETNEQCVLPHLIANMSQLIKLAFIATTSSPSLSITNYGLQILANLVRLFGASKDGHGDYCLSQYSAQITSSLYQLLNFYTLNQSSNSIASVYELCADWLCCPSSSQCESRRRLLRRLCEAVMAVDDTPIENSADESVWITNQSTLMMCWARIYKSNNVDYIQNQHRMLSLLGRVWLGIVLEMEKDNGVAVDQLQHMRRLSVLEAIALLYKAHAFDDIVTETHPFLLRCWGREKGLFISRLSANDVFYVTLGLVMRCTENARFTMSFKMNANVACSALGNLLSSCGRHVSMEYAHYLQLIAFIHRMNVLEEKEDELDSIFDLLIAMLAAIKKCSNKLASNDVQAFAFFGLEPFSCLNRQTAAAAKDVKRVALCADLFHSSSPCTHDTQVLDAFERKTCDILSAALTSVQDYRYIFYDFKQILNHFKRDDDDKFENLLIDSMCKKINNENHFVCVGLILRNMRNGTNSFNTEAIIDLLVGEFRHSLKAIAAMFHSKSKKILKTCGILFLEYCNDHLQQQQQQEEEEKELVEKTAIAYLSTLSDPQKRKTALSFLVRKMSGANISMEILKARFKEEYPHIVLTTISSSSSKTLHISNPEVLDFNKFL